MSCCRPSVAVCHCSPQVCRVAAPHSFLYRQEGSSKCWLAAAAVANNPSLSLGLLSRIRVDICSPSAMRSILRFLMPWSGTGRRALGANGTRFARCVTLRVVRVRWDGSKFVQLAVTLAVSHTARCWSRLVEGRRSVTGEAMLSLLRVS